MMKRESVWDYPRPPALEPVDIELRIVAGVVVVAATTGGYRVLETSHPPVYYFPPGDIDRSLLRDASGSSYCEWKGVAQYHDLILPHGEVLEQVAWSYPEPTRGFADIAGHLAFYIREPLECYVGEERATPQPGGFYGGWVTSNLEGPFKGGPGSRGW